MPPLAVLVTNHSVLPLQRNLLMVCLCLKVDSQTSLSRSIIAPTVRIVTTDGITTLEQLSALPDLTTNQRLGIKYFSEFEEKIPREEVTRLWVCARDHEAAYYRIELLIVYYEYYDVNR